jgi:hypothetical protein
MRARGFPGRTNGGRGLRRFGAEVEARVGLLDGVVVQRRSDPLNSNCLRAKKSSNTLTGAPEPKKVNHSFPLWPYPLRTPPSRSPVKGQCDAEEWMIFAFTFSCHLLKLPSTFWSNLLNYVLVVFIVKSLITIAKKCVKSWNFGLKRFSS